MNNWVPVTGLATALKGEDRAGSYVGHSNLHSFCTIADEYTQRLIRKRRTQVLQFYDTATLNISAKNINDHSFNDPLIDCLYPFFTKILQDRKVELKAACDSKEECIIMFSSKFRPIIVQAVRGCSRICIW